MRHSPLIFVIALAIGAGCGDGDPAAPRMQTPGDDLAPAAAPAPPSIASPKANVRFLDANRLSKSFAKALGVKESELCKELGQFDCVGAIHKISLLGTDPYLFGVNDPLPSTTTSTPLVVERVATAGCVTRVDADRTRPAKHLAPVAAAIFDRLVVDASGKLDPGAPEVGAAIDRLYVKVMQRHATAAEVEDFRQLYRDVEAVPAETTPARDWAVATCVAVLTSMESIFY